MGIQTTKTRINNIPNQNPGMATLLRLMNVAVTSTQELRFMAASIPAGMAMQNQKRELSLSAEEERDPCRGFRV